MEIRSFCGSGRPRAAQNLKVTDLPSNLLNSPLLNHRFRHPESMMHRTRQFGKGALLKCVCESWSDVADRASTHWR